MPRPTAKSRPVQTNRKRGTPPKGAKKARPRQRAQGEVATPTITLARANAMVEALSREFASALAAIGATGQGPRALSRTLELDVVLCHRLLAGIRSAGTVADRIAKWPGEAGLKMLAQQIRVRTNGTQAQAMVDAVDEFSRLMSLAGGSRTQLVRRVKALQGPQIGGLPVGDLSPKSARRDLNRAAGEILGYDVAVVTHVAMLRPIPGQPELIEGCSALGLIGIESQGSSICVASNNVQMRGSASDVVTEARWRPLGRPVSDRDGMLEEFCSSHSVLVESTSSDGYIRQMVDLNLLSAAGSADVVLARAWRPDSNPQYTNDPIWSHVLRMRHPAKRMLFDAYMHRSTLDSRPPEAGAYVWHPALRSDPRNQWHDRFPVSCPVQILPPTPAPCEAWSKQQGLTDRLFELVGWDRSEFVGFRFEDSAPVWSAAYFMTFNLRSCMGAEPERA